MGSVRGAASVFMRFAAAHNVLDGSCLRTADQRKAICASLSVPVTIDATGECGGCRGYTRLLRCYPSARPLGPLWVAWPYLSLILVGSQCRRLESYLKHHFGGRGYLSINSRIHAHGGKGTTNEATRNEKKLKEQGWPRLHVTPAHIP